MELNEVYRLFPAMLEIGDGELRRKCGETFREAIEERGWTEETLRQCPVDMDNHANPGNCLDHFQDVAMAAILVYDYMKGKHGDKVGSTRDCIIASAILHDVGKLYEYSVTPDGPAYAPDQFPVRHPLRGAMLAERHGLPNKILFAIASHNFEGDRAKPTLEYHYTRLLDHLVFYSLYS